MYHKKGFSLLSFLLYLMLFTMITFFSCHIIVALIIPSLTSMRKCQSIIALHLASDLFVRDIRAIHTKREMWKVINSHELVWSTENQDIGWQFLNNSLIRNEGIYNQGWKSKTTSIVATGIREAIFTIEQSNNHIIGIELTLRPIVSIKKPIICYVAVKQGKI